MHLTIDVQAMGSANASAYYRSEVKRHLNQFKPVFAYGKITISEDYIEPSLATMKGFYLVELPNGKQSTAPFMWMINHLKSGKHTWESFDSHPEGANTLLEIRSHRIDCPVMLVPDNFLRPPGNKYAKHLLEKVDD